MGSSASVYVSTSSNNNIRRSDKLAGGLNDLEKALDGVAIGARDMFRGMRNNLLGRGATTGAGESGSSGVNRSSGVIDLKPCIMCRSTFSKMKKKIVCKECRAMFCDNCLDNRSMQCKTCKVVHLGNKESMQHLKITELKRFLKSHGISTEKCREKGDLIRLCLRFLASQYVPSSPSSDLSSPLPNLSLNPLPRNFSSYYYDSPNAASDIAQPTSPHDHPTSTSEEVDDNSNNTSRGQPVISSRLPSTTDEDNLTPVEIPTTRNLSAPTLNVSPSPNLNPPSESSGRSASSPNVETLGTRDQPPSIYMDEDGHGVVLPKKRRASISDIMSESDIEKLTIHQCKEILANNFVDYRGCVEKWELVQRVKRLYTDKQRAQRILERTEQDTAATAAGGSVEGSSNEVEVCKICMDAPVDCVLLECGHMLTCTQCGKRLAECPICRQYVVRVVRTFRA